MVYSVIGLMSGSSLDGLDIVFAELQETAGKWSYELTKAECREYNIEWIEKLENAVNLHSKEYQLLHVEYGHYIGKEVNNFIERNNLQHQVNLIASHGHTTFHVPGKLMTHQIGDGAAIAAETKLPVVTDMRALDVAFGGQGAPIVPIGEKLLFEGYDLFLNLGGIANLSAIVNTSSTETGFIAFDVCAANRVLNMLSALKGYKFDEDGKIAALGNINKNLLITLNNLEYYQQLYPKSLANSFGINKVFPLIQSSAISVEDAMRTYVEHISFQIKNAIPQITIQESKIENRKLLITGGGAFNKLLIERMKEYLHPIGVEIIIPSEEIINYKEALIMALIGTLRWREEYNVLSSVTGAKRNSIGGALWLGTEA